MLSRDWSWTSFFDEDYNIYSYWLIRIFFHKRFLFPSWIPWCSDEIWKLANQEFHFTSWKLRQQWQTPAANKPTLTTTCIYIYLGTCNWFTDTIFHVMIIHKLHFMFLTLICCTVMGSSTWKKKITNESTPNCSRQMWGRGEGKGGPLSAGNCNISTH